jgi:hypothetical protein
MAKHVQCIAINGGLLANKSAPNHSISRSLTEKSPSFFLER